VRGVEHDGCARAQTAAQAETRKAFARESVVLKGLLGSLWRREKGGEAARKGLAALHAGDLRAAEVEFRRALAASCDTAEVYSGLGRVLWQQGRLDEGLEALRLAVDREPSNPRYQLDLALALEKGAPDESLQHLRMLQGLLPDEPQIEARLHKLLMELCDWDAVERAVNTLEERARREPAEQWTLRVDPFVVHLLPIDQTLVVEAVRQHARRVARAATPVERAARAAPSDRCRLGYVAAEFRDHATAHLAAGLFEQHDRGRFALHAYSLSRGDGSDYEQRARAAFDHFVDLSAVSDVDAARRIASDGVDVLIDLKGYTSGARPGIFARRPAPVQVNYLGYPGSMQAEFIDYIVADAVVVPEPHFQWFSESVLWLPGSYQPNDDRQRIDDLTPSRAALGLPERGTVYCCFNRSYKIERETFAAWMRILSAVPGSVLWLLWSNAATEARLRDAASLAGVDPARLVFARRMPKPEHLARHRVADLFLDTHTVNAHTTASDALWAGLPLITWPGETFASRVAASLLEAVGLPELVVSSLADYERTAVALGRDSESLRRVRARLADNRLEMPLFRTADYARGLERALEKMHSRQLRGERPEAFAV
jgi:protein O-GlcNAc transferase